MSIDQDRSFESARLYDNGGANLFQNGIIHRVLIVQTIRFVRYIHNKRLEKVNAICNSDEQPQRERTPSSSSSSRKVQLQKSEDKCTAFVAGM